MNRFPILIFSIFLFTMISCESSTKSEDIPIENIDEGFEVKINKSAGEKYQEEDQFLMLPFNIAKHSGQEIIVLAPRIKHGKTVKVAPIGMAQYTQQDSLINVVLAIPTDTESNYEIMPFTSFATVHASTLWMIEHYLVSHSGKLEKSRFEGWVDEHKTKTYLMSKTKTEQK